MLLFSYLLMSGVTTGALYALVALGIVVVNKATGVINFAQGEFFMFTGFVGWMLHVQFGMNYPLSFLLAVIVGFVLGMLTDRIAFRPIAKNDIVSLVLATVGIGFILKGLARVIWGGKADYLSFPPITSPDPIMVGPLMVIPQQLAVLAGTIIIMLVFAAFFRLTRAGKMMQATADNPRAALLVGIRTDRIYTLAFGTGAAIAAAAAVLTAPLTLLYPDIGFAFFLKRIRRRGPWRLDEPAWCCPRRAYRRRRQVAGGRLYPFQRDGAVAVPGDHGGAGAAAERPSQLPQGEKSVVPFGRRNVLLVLLAIGAIVPAFANGYQLFVSNLVAIYILLAIGLNILVGYAGQLAFANAAMFGIGAYATGLLQVHLGWPFWVAFPSGGLIAAAVGTLLALPALRMSGLYLALSTLAFAQATQWVFLHWENVTFGAGGFKTPHLSFAPLPVDKSVGLYYLSLVLVVLLYLFGRHVVTSRIGRAFVAVRDSEVAAESLGIDLLRYKALAFGISGFYAGVAGGLYSALLNFVAPEGYDLFQIIIQKSTIVVGGMDRSPGRSSARRSSSWCSAAA